MKLSFIMKYRMDNFSHFWRLVTAPATAEVEKVTTLYQYSFSKNNGDTQSRGLVYLNE